MGFQSTQQPTTQVQAVDIPPDSLQQPPGRLEGSCVLLSMPSPLAHILLPLQPHNYLTEQPTSFWLEQARGVPVMPPSPCPCQHPGSLNC